MVGVAALVETEGGTVTSARLGANGVLDHGIRLEAVEDALVGESPDEETIEAAASAATDGVDEAMVMSDLQASAEFRATLLEAYTKRALAGVTDRAAPPAAD
jgi:carbon-monoxide dehydrogenase medium subunit